MHLCFSLLYLFIYFWLCWVFVAVWTFLYLPQAGAGFLLQRLLLLPSTASRVHQASGVSAHGPVVVAPGLLSTGSIVGAQGPSWPVARGILRISDQTLVSHTGRWVLHRWAMWKPINLCFSLWLSPHKVIFPDHLLNKPYFIFSHIFWCQLYISVANNI